MVLYLALVAKVKQDIIIELSLIDLVTAFDAILTRRQTLEKLQCLHENLISNYFRRTAILKIILFANLSFISNDSTKKIWGVLNLLEDLEPLFEFPIDLSVRKSREKLQTNMEKFKHRYAPQFF